MTSAAAVAHRLQPRVVLITGGSKGYGRAVAIALSQEADSSRRTTELLLVARDAAALEETAKALHGSAARVPHVCIVMDLGSAATVNQSMDKLLDTLEAAVVRIGGQQPEGSVAAAVGAELLVIHNAGSLGDLVYCQDLSPETVQSSIDLNVTSFLLLNNAILKRFGPGTAKNHHQAGSRAFSRITIVNISSLLAVQPFASWSLYASGKAARDMAMRVIAQEAASLRQRVKTLSWAPGPMRTEMTDQIMRSCADKSILDMFQKMHIEDRFVELNDSAIKLLKLLSEDRFDSGAHVDFYDVD